MKALLTKKWGGNYAGQVLTNVEKGSIPSEVATFYEDDQPTPNDIVKAQEADVNHLPVINDAIDPQRVTAADKSNQDKMDAAKDAPAPLGDLVSEAEAKETQRRAREADVFAGKRASGKKAELPKAQKAKMNTGKDHGVK